MNLIGCSLLGENDYDLYFIENNDSSFHLQLCPLGHLAVEHRIIVLVYEFRDP